MTTTTANLPVAITRLGGDLEKAMREIDLYTDPAFPLDRKGQFAVARLIERHPDLNREEYVAVIIDLFAYHRVGSGVKLADVISDYGIATSQIVFTYLYESAVRTRGEGVKMPKHRLSPAIPDRFPDKGGNETKWSGAMSIGEICELILTLEAENFEVYDASRLDEAIQYLGGLYKACSMSPDQVASAFQRENQMDGEHFDGRGDRED